MKEVFLGFLASLVLRALNATLRWEKQGLHVDGKHWGYHEPLIVCFWHSDQLFAPWAYLGFAPPANAVGKERERRKASVLISEHSDGRIIAEALRFLSIGNIPGSSTRGGVRALVQMKKTILKERVHITITPDGPKGPAQKVKPGIITLSSQTGSPILPFSIAYESCWKAKSWDQMMLPKPFSRARIIGGELMRVPSDLSQEDLKDYSEKLEKELLRLKKIAEKPFLSEETGDSALSNRSEEGHNSSDAKRRAI